MEEVGKLAWTAGTGAGIGFADGTGAGVSLKVGGWVVTIPGTAVATLAGTGVAETGLGLETGIGAAADAFELGCGAGTGGCCQLYEPEADCAGAGAWLAGLFDEADFGAGAGGAGGVRDGAGATAGAAITGAAPNVESELIRAGISSASENSAVCCGIRTAATSPSDPFMLFPLIVAFSGCSPGGSDVGGRPLLGIDDEGEESCCGAL